MAETKFKSHPDEIAWLRGEMARPVRRTFASLDWHTRALCVEGYNRMARAYEHQPSESLGHSLDSLFDYICGYGVRS